jgi:hypothetical protein
MGVIKVPLKSPSAATSPKYYWTNLDDVRLVVRSWANGEQMSSPEMESLGMREDRYHSDHERIRSRLDPVCHPVERTWLTSSWVQIGVNIAGAKILVDYTIEYLDNHFYGAGTPAMEEIVNHIVLAKEMYPECSLWSPQAWKLFPLSESPMDLQFPF